MGILKWRKQTDEHPVKSPEKITIEIAEQLLQHYNNGTITLEQLNKINNIAANTGRLSSLLTWL